MKKNSSLTNLELINNFTEYLKENNKSVSTIIAYKKDLQQFNEINKDKSFDLYTPDDIKSAVNELRNVHKVTLKTVSRKINSIRSFFKYLYSNQLVSNNPSTEISHPKYRNKKPRVLSQMEYYALREASRNNFRLNTMIELLLQTGLRISELSNLQKRDLYLDEKSPYLVVRGYSSTDERSVPLNYKIKVCLRNYLNQDNTKFQPLFSTKTGKNIEIRNIRTSIDKAIANAQIKNACVNDLRNTFIVAQLSSGMSLDFLAKIVGHKNINTTLKYTMMLSKKYQPSSVNHVVEL